MNAQYPDFQTDPYADIKRFKSSMKKSDSSFVVNDPEPLPLENKLAEVLPFKLEMLPKALQAFVKEVAESIGVAQDMIAIPLVCCLSIIIGIRAKIKPKQRSDWKVTPNLWGGIIAPPASFKSPSINAVLRLLSRLEDNYRAEYDEQLAAFKTENAILKENINRIKNKFKNGKASEIDKTHLNEYYQQEKQLKEPKPKRYLTNDSTIEKICELYSSNSTGLMIYRDELTSLFESVERKENANERATYLEAWAGDGSHAVDRIGRGSFKIERFCLSIFGGMQPDKIFRYIQSMYEGNNDGFIQRFQLLIYPDKKQNRYTDSPISELTQKQIRNVFTELDTFLNKPFQTQINGSTDFLSFNKQAQQLYIKWFNENQKDIENNEYYDKYLKEHFSKYNSLIPSLALIFYLVDHYKSESLGAITKPYMEMALEWEKYLKSHALRIYGIQNQSSQLANTLLNKLIQNYHSFQQFKSRDIYRKGWARLTNKEAVEKQLSKLEEYDYIIEVPVESPTKRTKVYRLNKNLCRQSTDNTDSKDVVVSSVS